LLVSKILVTSAELLHINCLKQQEKQIQVEIVRYSIFG